MENTRIQVSCLRCGHSGSLSEDMLPLYGEEAGAPIAKFAHRLSCVSCGSKSIKAYRVANELVFRSVPA
jgi:hypothetical protein